MDIKLLLQAIIKFLFGVLLVGGILFLSAFSFDYWNAWLFMGLLFIPMFIVGIILIFKNPELLKRRLNGIEKESEQKSIIFLSGIMFLLGFIVAGLNFRYSFCILPNLV